jgi:hypothetical protein
MMVTFVCREGSLFYSIILSVGDLWVLYEELVINIPQHSPTYFDTSMWRHFVPNIASNRGIPPGGGGASVAVYQLEESKGQQNGQQNEYFK